MTKLWVKCLTPAQPKLGQEQWVPRYISHQDPLIQRMLILNLALKANVQLIWHNNLLHLRHLPLQEEVCATIAINQTISKRIAGGRKVHALYVANNTRWSLVLNMTLILSLDHSPKNVMLI
jgi:hypothetical protein